MSNVLTQELVLVESNLFVCPFPEHVSVFKSIRTRNVRIMCPFFNKDFFLYKTVYLLQFNCSDTYSCTGWNTTGVFIIKLKILINLIDT